MSFTRHSVCMTASILALTASWSAHAAQTPASDMDQSTVAGTASANDVGPLDGDALQDDVADIVVTARSAGESMMKVPVAVSALTQSDITRYQSSDLGQLTQQVPLVQVFGGGINSGGTYVIRGVGSTGDDAGLEQAVALYSDGVYIRPPSALFVGQFDLQQVEILKGPQALFFGKNSPSGVVSLRSANPGRTLNGYVRGGYEFDAHEHYVEAAIGGPVTDSLGVRIAGIYKKMRGYVENRAPAIPDPLVPGITDPGATKRFAPDAETYAVRGTLLFEPTDQFSSNLKISYGRYSDSGPFSTASVLCAPGQAFATSSPIYGVIPSLTDTNAACGISDTNSRGSLPSEYTSQSIDPRWHDGNGFNIVETLIGSWTSNLDLGSFKIVGVTGYVDLNRGSRDNANGTVYPFFFGGPTERFNSFSQEFRVITQLYGPLNFTLGAYYETSDSAIDADVFVGPLGRDPVTGNWMSATKTSFVTGDTYSVFGQVRYQLLPNLEFAGGVRFTSQQKSGRQSNAFVNPVFATAFPGPDYVISSKVSEKNWSPEATITWNPTPDSTLYAAYKTGYLSGGISTPNVLVFAHNEDNISFRPEKVKGGEVGYKAALLDRRLRLELNAYYYEYDDLQVASFDAVTISATIGNAAKLTQKGIDGSLTFRLSDAFTLRASGGYNDTSYDSYAGAPCYAFQTIAQGCTDGIQDLTGRRLDRAPKFAGTVGFTVSQPISNDWTIALDADANYSSSYSASQTQNPIGTQKAYAQVNAGIRIFQEDEGLELALIGRNLTDKRVIGYTIDKPGGGPGEVLAITSRGRQVSLQGTFRF